MTIRFRVPSTEQVIRCTWNVTRTKQRRFTLANIVLLTFRFEIAHQVSAYSENLQLFKLIIFRYCLENDIQDNRCFICTRTIAILGLGYQESYWRRTLLFNTKNGLIVKVWNQRDRHQMKTMKFEEDYQVIFSLLNGNPSDTLVTWDIDGAVHSRSMYIKSLRGKTHQWVSAYLDPFVQSVSSINKLSISSQVAFVLLRAKTDHSTVTKQIQNYAELPIKEQTMLLNDEPIQVIKQESLPLFVNSAEWNLAPAVSVSPPINLVLYVPAKKSRPLHLLKHNGALSGTNSFLIHRWGGISVQNLPLGYDGLSYHFGTQEMKPVMELFVSQLRGLMGIRETTIYNSAELFVSF